MTYLYPPYVEPRPAFLDTSKCWIDLMQVNKLDVPLQVRNRFLKYVNSYQSVSVLVECIIVTDDLIII